MALEIDLGPQARAFRDEVRQWLEANRPDELIGVDVERAAMAYGDPAIQAWVAAHPRFRYTPVLSAAEPEDQWSGRTGLVHEAVIADYPNLANLEIYASGPPAMIEAIKQSGAAHGLTPDRLHFDSFEYAPDALAKMRGAGIRQ